MSAPPLLYNSRIIDTYLQLLRKNYPDVDIPVLLDFAGMKSYQVADSGHWFSQEQVDRFYEKLVEASGDPEIAREAGRYAASADAVGILRQYVLGALGPAHSFRLISKTAPLLTRSATYASRRLGPCSVEITVTPKAGVEEKAFQCANRLGWFEAFVTIFGCRVETIEHPQCLFRGDPVCRYRIAWATRASIWKRLRNVSWTLLLPLAVAGGVFLSPLSGMLFLLGGGWIASVLALMAEREETGRLKAKVTRIQEEADRALTRISANHDNAVLIDEVGRTISQETNIEAVLARVVDLLSERLDFDRVMVFLADRDRDRLELQVEHGFSAKMVAQVRNLAIPIDPAGSAGLIVRAFLEQRSVLVENVDAWRDSFSAEGYRLVKELEADSFVFSPIVCSGQSRGILAAAKNGGRHPLVQTDLSLIEGVAAYIGIALRNAELLETLSGQLQQIRERDDALERHRRNLEEQVRLRTALMQEALQAAEAASKAKSEFLANMSHEIRTPLHGIVGLNELLLESGLSAHQRQLSQRVQGCAETLLQVITDVLDFSKIEANKMELEEVPFDLAWLLRDAVALFAPQAASKGIALTLKRSDEVPPWIKGDPLRLRQVLNNLVGNAVKFTETGGVALSVSSCGGESTSVRLRFVVRDTGIGMSAQQKAGLFESFYQGDGSTSRRYGGSGLGTTISKRLVELMHGEIGCESVLGEGSSFWFEIPVSAVPIPPESDLGRGEFCASEGAGRILVVEDNPVNRDIIRLHLEGDGYTVALAQEGGEALASLQAQPFDLILMDIQMPGMDGYEATRRIRSRECGDSNALIPIVALTANATAADRQKCLDLGMNDVIVKPVRKKDFLAKMHRYFSRACERPPLRHSAPASDGGEPLNFEEALNEFGADGAVLGELITLFFRDTEQVLARIEGAREAGDADSVSALAHGIKGTAGLLFALPLSRAARELEKIASGSDAAQIKAACRKVRAEFRKLQQAWSHWASSR